MQALKGNYSGNVKPLFKPIVDSVYSGCLHFVSDCYGSAFMISQNGYILTCQHCAYSDIDRPGSEEFQLILPSGQIFPAFLVMNDDNLGVALLKTHYNGPFPFVQLGTKTPPKGSQLFCIGQPAQENLDQHLVAGDRTDFPPFYVSHGKVEGIYKDILYGAEGLGPLMHSCWTYWGHSGAPIFDQDGFVVGMHNSWDSRNAMRHGVTIEAIRKFLKEVESLYDIKF